MTDGRPLRSVGAAIRRALRRQPRATTTTPGHPPADPRPARHAFTPTRPTVYALTGDLAGHGREAERMQREREIAELLGTDQDGLHYYAADREDD